MKAIAWASCYLVAPDPVYAALSEMGQQLREQGMELVMFGPAGDYSTYTGFQHIELPHFLGEQGQQYGAGLTKESEAIGATSLAEMVAIDCALGMQWPDDLVQKRVAQAMAFWERAFDIAQPSVVIGWGTIVPTARLMVRIAQRRQIPAYIMERGLMGNTLGLSLAGQVALSSVSTSPALINPLPLTIERRQAWEVIEDYYRQLENRRYPGRNRIPDMTEWGYMRMDPKPRVMYYGTCDVGGGLCFTDPALGERANSWVATSIEAGQVIAEKLEKISPQATLWSKPHPLTPFTLDIKTKTLTVRNITEVDSNVLAHAADICVTMTSTTMVLGYIYDKPVVTLANGFLMGRNLTYEVTKAEELQPALAAALARDGWNERLENGRALLVAMMEHDLFGINSEVPTRLKMVDMAIMLGRFTPYVKMGTAPAPQRYATFLQFMVDAKNRGLQLSNAANA